MLRIANTRRSRTTNERGETASSVADSDAATLGKLAAAIDLELPEAPRLLAELTPEPRRKCRVTRPVLQPLAQPSLAVRHIR